MNKATLRLFKAIQINNKTRQSRSDALDQQCIKNGYFFDAYIHVDQQLMTTADEIFALSGEQANAAFHKSWKKIQEASLESLALQQVMHYVSTYGFKLDGCYSDETIYIPHEMLKIPDVKKDIPVIRIKAMTADEILTNIIQLSSGIALSQESLADIMSIIKANQFDSSFVQKIENRELLALLQDHYDIIPDEPVAYLRYVVNKLTNESLLIKNKSLLDKIKQANGKKLDWLLLAAPENLAEIFFRYKPLFLAMKKIAKNKNYFNQLRKKAKKLHRPLKADYLSQVTAMIKSECLDLQQLTKQLKQAKIFKKVRLAYALSYRIKGANAIAYKIRNGKGWATRFEWYEKYKTITKQAYEIVIASIVDDLKVQVKEKNIYIPANVFYALPATEKQFTGFFPTGSFVTVPEDIIVGIHWNNTKRMIDLDLGALGQSGKIGWDSNYRSDDLKVLFSGDITSAPAPLGASELFYFKKGGQETRLLTVNYYNYQKNDEVDCEILVAQEQPKDFHQNYMIDINNMVAKARIKIKMQQNIIGLFANIDGENRIYFCNTSVGTSFSSRNNPSVVHTRKYLFAMAESTIDFKSLLKHAGAYIHEERPECEYIDLSPDAIDKSSFINLMI